MIFERWRLARALHRIPELAPDTPEGTVARATGIVRATLDELVAPRSQRRCVGFSIRLKFGRRSTNVGGKFDGCKLLPFTIERARDLVEIESTNARFALPRARAVTTRSPEWRQFLVEHAIVGPDMHVGWLVRESVVEVGMMASVAGRVLFGPPREPPTSVRGFRDPPPRSYRLIGDFGHPLLIGPAR